MDERTRRVGENEALFRVVNERIEDVNRAFGAVIGTMAVVCECGAIECAEQITLTPAEYERVRADPTSFVLVPGHEEPDLERVVSRGDGYVIVQKIGRDAAALARDTNPRG
jgi:hypothetical protein